MFSDPHAAILTIYVSLLPAVVKHGVAVFTPDFNNERQRGGGMRDITRECRGDKYSVKRGKKKKERQMLTVK